MERSKKAKLQLSKTTLSDLSGGGYMYSGGKGGIGKGPANGEIYLKAGKFAGKDSAKMIPTFGDICATGYFC